MSYVRVVRFTDVSAESMGKVVEMIEGSDGPPEGVPASGIRVMYDADQQTAVVVQMFASAEDMAAGAKVLTAMDPAETPGTRASVDMCEVKVNKDAP